ncbi:cyclic nucleotide-binding domain protein (macronuclear) [Tetrahymena thermophila SB210]|uniref:Cyclic nucleotide-binding domain protein n=1 Tax=Tetrahymena thermophila (strain SB210) TaxID=312017 RepID=I7M870_TETTS|nr:cyclic nucleotide-binding domain protein [Tetrahymena thermophila SB210]EAR97283.2 cyclic nucleotide-binding domain protein [Tetrahymena thermophila SB210]|eukprot:XP_001017528.2 cyclic nucleotide-binding domain protein [Tetrahymena thermophila SB210]
MDNTYINTERSKYLDVPSIEYSISAMISQRNRNNTEKSLNCIQDDQQNQSNSNQQGLTYSLGQQVEKIKDNQLQKEFIFYDYKLPFKKIDSESEQERNFNDSVISDKLEPMIISLSQKKSDMSSPIRSPLILEDSAKKKDKIKKKNKYFADLIENSTITQSAKKEKEKQQENMKTFFEQENDYLKNVYGKYYEQSKFQSIIPFNLFEKLQQKQNQDKQEMNKEGQNITQSQMNVLETSRERSTTLPIARQIDSQQYSQFRRQSVLQKSRLFTFCQNINNRTIEKDSLFHENRSINLDKNNEIKDEKARKQDKKGQGILTLLRIRSQNQNQKQINEDIRREFQKKVGIFTKINRFLYNLQLKSGLKNPKWLNDYILNVIGDLSFSKLENAYQVKTFQHLASIKPNKTQLRKQMTVTDKFRIKIFNFQKQYSSIIQKLPIIDPSSITKQLWDIFIIFYILLAVVIVPIDRFILFYTQTPSLIVQFRTAIYSFFTIVAAVDILSQFCIGIYHQGEVILNRKIIAQSYLRGQFILDIITFTVILLRFFVNDTQIYNCLIFLKLYKLEKILQQQYEFQIIRFNKGHFVQLVQIFLTDIFIIHLIVSLFIYIGFSESSKGWVSCLQLQSSDWFNIYTQTFYSILMVHLAQGQNIIKPVNNFEFWFLSISTVLLISSLLRSIKKLQKVLSDYKKKDKEALKQMRLINIYLRDKNIGQRLKIKIVKYLQFQMNQRQQIPIQQEHQILQLLSQELREQILVETNLQIIQRSTILANFSLSTQKKASTYLELRTIHENETIFEEGDYSENPYYYFLKQGEIEFFVESVKGSQQILRLQTLQKDNWFGEMSFLTQKERIVGAIAKQKCEVYTLSRQDFLCLLQEQSRDYIKFSLLEEKLRMNETHILKMKCWSCESIEHTIKNCPLIHFVPDIEKVILKEKFSLPQKRKNDFERYRYLKQSSVKLQKLAEQQLKKFKKKNMSLIIEAKKKMTSNKKKKIKKDTIFSETNILKAESLRLQLAQIGNKKQGLNVPSDEINKQIGAKLVDSLSDILSIDKKNDNINYINSAFTEVSSRNVNETLKLQSQRDRNISENSKQGSKTRFSPQLQVSNQKLILKSVNNYGQNQNIHNSEEDKQAQESISQLCVLSPQKAQSNNNQNTLHYFSQNSLQANLQANVVNPNINSLNYISTNGGGGTPHQLNFINYGNHGFGSQIQQITQTPQFSSQIPTMNLNSSNASLNTLQQQGMKSNTFFNSLTSVQKQNSYAAPSPSNNKSISIIKTQSYNRGANKAAAIQSQQISDLQILNEEILLDFNTAQNHYTEQNAEDASHNKSPKEASISPINESDPNEEHDSRIFIENQKKKQIKKDNSFGVYSIFSRKKFFEEDQKYQQSRKQSIFKQASKQNNYTDNDESKVDNN